jgi:hypothetical protein
VRRLTPALAALRCLGCGGSRVIGPPAAEGGRFPSEGHLRCSACRREYPVVVCDTYDWYAPRFQHHHTVAEALGWFHAWGFEDVRALRGYTPRGSRCDWIHDHGLLPGSGISVVGRRPPTAAG